MDNALRIINELNKNEYLSHVKVPILDGFEIVPNEGTLFTAISKEKYIEQFLSEGVLFETQSFEDRVQAVINTTKKSMTDNQMEDVEENLRFFKDLETDDFHFKIYIQDNVCNHRIMRQLNAYFVDTDTKGFFEVTLCTCAYKLKEEKNVLDGDVTNNLIRTFDELLKHIKKDN